MQVVQSQIPNQNVNFNRLELILVVARLCVRVCMILNVTKKINACYVVYEIVLKIR